MPASTVSPNAAEVSRRIRSIRGQRVLLDSDLAVVYGVSTKRLNEQVRRNVKYLPYAFTEHGAVMTATVLNSRQAVQMSILIVRAFVELRVVVATNAVLEQKPHALEKSVAVLDADTKRRFKDLKAVVFSLASPPTREQ